MSIQNVPAIVDQYGREIRSDPFRGAHSAAGNVFEAANQFSAELGSWYAPEITADSALLPNLKTLRGRHHDAVRNNGFMSGAVQTHLDNIIGSGLRLNVRPDWKYLGLDKDSDSDRTAEWERMTQAKFRNWAYDVNNYCDASRRKNFAGIMAQAYRSYLTSFEILGTSEWIERRGSKFRTAIQMIDPARLSNPNGQVDSNRLRAGVELGDMGDPIAHHISSSLDQFADYSNPVRKWTRVPTETEWGRKLVLHRYDEEQPGQSRGKTGIVSVLSKLKMLEKFEGVTLQASILNAMYAAVIESSMDWQSVASGLGAVGNDNPLSVYMGNVADYHGDKGIRFNGVKIPHLFPGEQLKMTAPEHPSAQFNMFEEAALRYLSAGANLTYEQFSRDWSKSNYSSARGALLEVWRFFNGRHAHIAAPFATDVYLLWLEEAIDNSEVELLSGAPDFYEAKTAWGGCKWIGPGRSHIDPEKEANATRIEYGMHLTTLEEEAALRGRDWEEVLEQRKQEDKRMRQLGLNPEAVLAAALNAKPTGMPAQEPAAPAQ
jgi:lambda family phage portal protein